MTTRPRTLKAFAENFGLHVSIRLYFQPLMCVFSINDRNLIPGLSQFYLVRWISKYSQELAKPEEESVNNSKLPTYYIN